jgi:hypothetical protein
MGMRWRPHFRCHSAAVWLCAFNWNRFWPSSDPGVNVQVMYIMAALAGPDSSDTQEVVLARVKVQCAASGGLGVGSGGVSEGDMPALQYDANGVLHMLPDFTEDRLAYRLETSWGDVYEYEIHHASRGMSEAGAARERELVTGPSCSCKCHHHPVSGRAWAKSGVMFGPCSHLKARVWCVCVCGRAPSTASRPGGSACGKRLCTAAKGGPGGTCAALPRKRRQQFPMRENGTVLG